MRGSTCRARGDYTTKQTTEQGVGVWFGPAGTSFYLWARQTVTGPNHSMGWLYRDENNDSAQPSLDDFPEPRPHDTRSSPNEENTRHRFTLHQEQVAAHLLRGAGASRCAAATVSERSATPTQPNKPRPATHHWHIARARSDLVDLRAACARAPHPPAARACRRPTCCRPGGSEPGRTRCGRPPEG